MQPSAPGARALPSNIYDVGLLTTLAKNDVDAIGISAAFAQPFSLSARHNFIVKYCGGSGRVTLL